MKVYIELWNAKETWQALSVEEREAFMGKVGSSMGALADKGIKCMGFGFAEKAMQQADYDFFAVWEMQDADGVGFFEETVSGSGWFNYFEQINVVGDLQPPEVVIGHHIKNGGAR